MTKEILSITAEAVGDGITLLIIFVAAIFIHVIYKIIKTEWKSHKK